MYQRGFVFGVDIGTSFQQWMEQVFTPKFKSLHPNDEFAGYIVEPEFQCHFSPDDPSRIGAVIFSTSTASVKTQGLLSNVDHKAQYALRTGMDSSTALDNLHLVVPGDFVYDGFVCHRGIWAGGSGVRKEFDVVYVREIVDLYIELREEVVGSVIAVIDWARDNWDGDISDWKYLNGDPITLAVIRQAYAEAMSV